MLPDLTLAAARLGARVPREVAPNTWSRAIAAARAAGRTLDDLTETNPTRGGLTAAGPEELQALAHPAASAYDPEPRGLASARAAVAGYYAERGMAVDPGRVLLTTGTSESYAHLFRLLADPGDTILVPAPSYPLLEPIAALEGVRIEPYRLRFERRWRLDLESLDRALGPSVRAVVAIQPNHPTGSCLDGGEIGELEERCARLGAALVSDEVFADHPWPGPDMPARGLPSLLGPRAVPTFVLSGLSKVCGLPQMKLGWIAACGPDEAVDEAMQGLEWIADLFLSVGTPVQLALPRLLASRHAFQARVRDRLGVNLATLRAAESRGVLAPVPAQGGWAAVVRVPGSFDEESWALRLVDRGVIAHPGHFYDFAEEPLLVVSLIADPAAFARGIAAVEALATS